MEPSQLFLLTWAALVFWVLGQIWLVQIVVYPLFAQVGRGGIRSLSPLLFAAHSAASHHSWLCDFLLPVALALYGPAVPFWMSAGNVATGIVGMLVTVLLEIPRHTRLEKGGKNDATIAELIRYNWRRTLSISAQSVITLVMLRHVFGAA